MVGFLPEQFPLSGASLRGWLRGSLSRDIWDNLSGSEILDTLRENGAAIRTQDFFAIRRQVLDLDKHQETITNLTIARRVPVGLVNFEHGYDLNTAYVYRFKSAAIDPETGEIIESVYSWGSDDELTPRRAERQLLDALLDDAQAYGIDIGSLQLFSVWGNPNF